MDRFKLQRRPPIDIGPIHINIHVDQVIAVNTDPGQWLYLGPTSVFLPEITHDKSHLTEVYQSTKSELRESESLLDLESREISSTSQYKLL